MTILDSGEPKRRFLQGTYEPAEQSYRFCTYVIREQDLLYHTVTGMLVRLSRGEMERMQHLPSVYEPWMAELVRTGYLVPEDRRDDAELLRLRELLRAAESGNAVTHYTILPTTACNAHCSYCYEHETPVRWMSDETADRTAEFICSRSRGNPVRLNWFGGEPMLGEKQIGRICGKLRNRGVTYDSTMVTNGLLCTERTIRERAELWNLRQVQITLDGTGGYYNRIKAYRGYDGDAFAAVTENIRGILSCGIRAAVRLNLGPDNKEELARLINLLPELDPRGRGLSAEIAVLYENEGYEPTVYEESQKQSLQESREELEQLLRERNIRRIAGEERLPVLQYAHCMADRSDCVLINPDGGIGKCEHCIFDGLLGTVSGGEPDPGTFWTIPSRQRECGVCPMAPACIQLRECRRREPCTAQERERIRKKIVQRMREQAGDRQ